MLQCLGLGSVPFPSYGGVSTFKEVGIKKKSRTFKEVGVIKKPRLGGVPNLGLENESVPKRELLGLGRFPSQATGGSRWVL